MESIDGTKGSNERPTLMMKIIGPIINFVDQPWKMYPVGVLFGFGRLCDCYVNQCPFLTPRLDAGFDTASSIALLAIATLAKRNTDSGSVVPSSHVIILPVRSPVPFLVHKTHTVFFVQLLFTAGMSLLDSVDSVIMLYSYTGFSERANGWKLIEYKPKRSNSPKPAETTAEKIDSEPPSKGVVEEQSIPKIDEELLEAQRKAKLGVMSGLSIILTVMSILVAFTCVEFR